MKHPIASICFLLLPMAGISQDKRPVSVEDLMELKTVNDVRISPDGKSIAYVVSAPSLTRNQHEAALYVLPAVGGTAKRVAEKVRILNTPLPAPRLRWTPDSRHISFLGLKDDKPQVFSVEAIGSEALPVTDAPEGVIGFDYSPDGKYIACLTREPMSAEEQAQRKDQSFVMHADAPDRPVRVAIKLPDGTWRTVTPVEHFVESISWSPDGREIAYAAAPASGFTAQYKSRIYAVSIDGGKPRTIVDRTGMNSTPKYSPDGKFIAFTSSNGAVSLMSPRGLCVVASAGGAVKSHGLQDAWISDVTWAPDSKSLFLLATDGTYGQAEHMFEQPIVRVWTEAGKSERVGDETAANYNLSISADGNSLVYRCVRARDMGDVMIHSLKQKKATKLTEVNPQLHAFNLGEQKPLKWKSFDGKEIWGLLITPAGYKPGQRVPMLVYCHGGPNGGVTYGLYPQFMHVVSQVDYYPVEAFASAGYAVFFPMPRGGAGYGEAGQRSIVNDWGGADYKDIMAGVDFLIAEGIADPDRLGVMGASYGGYMTNWIVTQTARFKAASAGASISDLSDQYYLSDGGEVMAEYFKRPWEARESYQTHSPLTFASQVTTPLLIQQGERDNRVPAANAWKFYRALKQQGKTVELDIHPRSSHVFYEPMQEYMAQKRNFEWFRKWVKVD
jgi:dipeptidyl aminopeptidase/acylaminoacyl peptidase